MNKVAFHNLGCKVNSYETEAMSGAFTDAGYTVVPFDEKADIYVINTCTVTGVADKKSRQMIHRAKALNPDAIVVAAGCYVQADPERVLSDEACDIVVGNNDKYRIVELVEAGRNAVRDINSDRTYEKLHIDRTTEHTRAFVKIQDGCNQFCSYCLIPYVRGRVRSREEDDIAAEAQRLADSGSSEIVLTGIHLSSYGTDGSIDRMGPPLLKLIDRLSSIDGIRRIRLGSLEPRVITRSFAEELKSFERICPHFHLSLQSGCDATLKRMNRHYTTAEYAEKCAILREAFDHPALTTDVITGFPGETDEEFEITRAYLEELALYELHVFPYSLRKGTRAEKLPGRVPAEVKAARSNVLLEMSRRHDEAFRSFYRGRYREVLLEEKTLVDGKRYFSGHTREYIRELVPAEGHFEGETVMLSPDR